MIEVEVKTTEPVAVEVGKVYKATLPEGPSGQEVEIGAGLKLEDNVLSVDSDEINSTIEKALTQAKESGEFNGKDGNDYVLTESDKQEIADMIEIPESDGTKDYTELENKPKINGVELNGDLTPEELGLNVGGEEWEVIADITLEEEAYTIDISTDINGNPFEMMGFYIYVRCPIAASQQGLQFFRVYYYSKNNPSVTPLCVGGIGNNAFFEAMVCIELSNDYSPILQTLRTRTNKYGDFKVPSQNGEFPINQNTKGAITKLSFSSGMYYPAGTIIKVFKTR